MVQALLTRGQRSGLRVEAKPRFVPWATKTMLGS